MVPVGEMTGRPRRRIGKYLVTGRIGRGGMGMVYRGYDEVLEREVAVKTLTIEGTLDEESRQRFEIEAKAAAKLQHPNIVTVFELGEDRGIPFIAMELLPGMDLEQILRSGEQLLLDEKLDILVQVCRGLAFAHEHGVVHRDIKPSNIRLLDDGTAKIMDFGIAKLGGTGVTKTGMMVGTVHYMSPEQIRGKTLDGRSDVFSIGVILHELLTGQRPFGGTTATEILYKIVHEPAPSLSVDVGALAPRLQEILNRTLAKDPEERFSDAGRLADEVAAVMAARQGPAALSPQALETVNLSRRLLREGRVDESVRRLREVIQRDPESVEARRALRAAQREMVRKQRPAEPQSDDFPELEATFQVPQTRRSAETRSAMEPTVLAAQAHSGPAHMAPQAIASAPPAGTGKGLLVGASLALVATVVAGLWLVFIKGSSPGQGTVRTSVRSQGRGESILLDGKETGAVSTPLAPAAVILAVASDPPGAAVTLDGQRLPGTTPLEARLDPATDHGLVITLDGHRPQDVRMVAGKIPPQVKVTLEPAGPLGRVTLVSSFPIDVLWRGRIMAKGQVSPRISLPAGKQLLTLVSGAYYLRSNVTADVRGGADTAIEAPGTGKLNIRANPDNCEVFVDGVSAGYLPILDRAVAAGSHAVLFKWPDGTRREEQVQVPRGGPAYIVGRKD